MKNCVLGISCFGHDTAACLVDEKNGHILFASAQERFSNIKFDDAIPFYTIQKCINLANKLNYTIKYAAIASNHSLFMGHYFFSEINKILGNFNLTNVFINFLKNEAINYGYFNILYNKNTMINQFFEKNFHNINSSDQKELKKIIAWYFNWSVKHFKIKGLVQKFLKNIKVFEVDHHTAHAASVYYNSGFEKSNIIVFDGQGEQETITLFSAKQNKFNVIAKSFWPHSLGILYLKGTELLNYQIGDEYKVMGMSAYGKENLSQIFKNFYKIDNQGSVIFESNQYINLKDIKDTRHKCLEFNTRIRELVPKVQNSKFKQVHFDFAKTLQSVLEDIGINLSDYLYEKTKIKNICLSGGVALNGLLNNKILNSKNFNDAFVFPASGDDGTAVGAAQYLINKENFIYKDKLKKAFFGYSEDNTKILNNEMYKKKYLKKVNIKNIYEFAATELSKNKVISIFNGQAEFGPRALGGRSIIANPTESNIVEILNTKIKLREPFRPFAPICLSNYLNDFFKIKTQSSFMLFICETIEEKKHLIPGVVHNDGTARVQSVDESNTVFFNILTEFNKKTNIPVLINTSFNIGGEAIVNSIEEAINSFLQMDIDYLIINDEIFEKDFEKLKNFKKQKLDKFIKKRKNAFVKKNIHPKICISNYNYNFFVNFRSQLKQYIKQIVFGGYI